MAPVSVLLLSLCSIIFGHRLSWEQEEQTKCINFALVESFDSQIRFTFLFHFSFVLSTTQKQHNIFWDIICVRVSRPSWYANVNIWQTIICDGSISVCRHVGHVCGSICVWLQYLILLAVDARYVTVEIILASKIASTHVTRKPRWQSALVAHVPHQVVVGSVGSAALCTHVTALVVGGAFLLAGRRTAVGARHHGRRGRLFRA